MKIWRVEFDRNMDIDANPIDDNLLSYGKFPLMYFLSIENDKDKFCIEVMAVDEPTAISKAQDVLTYIKREF